MRTKTLASMITIGLLGGIASGKSTVAKLLAERGAVVLDADRAAHAALAEEAVQAAIRKRWGGGLFDTEGNLIRRKIAERVFGPGASQAVERQFLEGLIHPRVRGRLKSELKELRDGGQAVAVLDIPLLLEAGWADECDLLLFVESTQQERLARAAARGWDADELAWREAAQTPIDEKRRVADAVIENRSSPGALDQAVDGFWRDRVQTLPT